jgi:cysteine desulfurase/selenocysteine lyase
LPVSENYRKLFVGLDVEVPLLNGEKCRYINLDNAASTPPLKHVKQKVDEFMAFYSSVHRGTGFKSQLSTHAYEKARQKVLKFVGVDAHSHVCIFGKNTTEAVNKLARRFPYSAGRDVVLLSTMEHHSNDLPWRDIAKVVHVVSTPDGRLDEADFDAKLKTYRNRLALVSITGASNVTGFINPIHRLAEKAHAVGASIAVDCAQLAPHRKIEMLSLDDPAHLDFVMISAHKMYAPFGTGALVARRDIFEQGEPDLKGGGEVEIVTLDQVIWSGAPERDEAGSPNTIGAVALAAAIAQLEATGMEAVAQHEAELTTHALKRLGKIKGIKIYGDHNPGTALQRLGVIPFNLGEMSHFKVAAILGYEFGIGVRNGCFCAHPYLLHLLGVNEEQALVVRNQIIQADRREVPGMVRLSFGLYNTEGEVDSLMDAIEKITRGDYRGDYIQAQHSGEFYPKGWSVDFDRYFGVDFPPVIK